MGAKTAKQQDALTELLDLLTQNGKKQEAAELSALFSQFAAMETQYGKVLSELAAVREQLATLHTKLIYENGERTQEAGKRITGDADPDLGKFLTFEEQPKDPAALQSVLRDEKDSREHSVCGNIKEHIEKLSGKGRGKKPSLRKQLAQDKETVKAAPKKQAAKTTNKGLEV